MQVAEHAARGGVTAQHSAAGAAPNVLVAHLEEGIEAVHLYSGRTLCKLHLPSPGLHADLNGDGVLDHVQVACPPHQPYSAFYPYIAYHSLCMKIFQFHLSATRMRQFARRLRGSLQIGT